MTDTHSRSPAGPDGPAAPEDGTPLALAALLSGTLVGTISNNVVNVPMPAIMADFDAPLHSGVFIVVGFLLTFTATMPVVGWIGDRFGRRRVYCASMVGTMVCAVGAATAPTLELLIMWRCLGGMAASALGPAVMGLLTWLFAGDRRGGAVGLWASVNGIGQAIGPTMGGFVADAWGWRWVFVPLVPVALAGLIGTLLHIPRYPGTRMSFDAVGATALTVGSGLLILGVGLVPRSGASPGVFATIVSAVVVLVFFVWHCLRTPDPFVDVRLVAESRFARSTLGAFAFMFGLGATLLAVPLYLVGHGQSGSVAGVVLLAVPAAMTVLGPLVGRYLDRIGPRLLLRTGLLLLIAGQLGLAAAAAARIAERTHGLAGLVAILVIVGIGIAFVQTPAATGATRSPAGAQGTGLGLYNLVRFSGSAMGAAWVAIALGVDSGPAGFVLAFLVVAGVALLGLFGSFVGPDPAPAR
ncbi:MFS transporter [Mycolicibacterium vaccae]|uniref:Major facilitator superfamily transporter n=1 Tax=Mycolicibacterium vaccae ATCC 25954 TaxID=1194972 RepID=K0V0J6_MYCVA|nr:MFS transporter [Mycolicibacterium vaccae]ANI38354.1 MFS transporter [Mycolicibacterium vaccae 95051]EJZ10860.1 major facilitator superfamily transporter [Mycolicibacterium vaccae ATCC 25954]MCV7064338.1 MFS transporter [Mycolicibacterium vaccae]